MQTYSFSPEMQVLPIKHKTKDVHSIHCMRSEKIYTGIRGMLCSFTFHLPPSSKSQDKSSKTNCKGLEQNTGLGFHSKSRPSFFYQKMEEKKASSKAMVLVKWLKILRTVCESNALILIAFRICLYQYFALGSLQLKDTRKENHIYSGSLPAAVRQWHQNSSRQVDTVQR